MRRWPSVAAALGVAPAEVARELAGLIKHGIVLLEDGHVTVLRAADILAAAIAREAANADLVQARLDDLARAVPLLVAAGSRPGPGEVEDVHAIDGEVSAGGNALHLLTDLIEQTGGDLLALRPDAWAMPRESAMSKVVGRAVASGRRSRAVYPLRALHEAPETLQARADEGEEVRLIDDLPTRLFIVAGTHAIVPEPIGFSDSPRLLVRQGALVAALTLLFELYWERGVPIHEMSANRTERHVHPPPAPLGRQGRADRAHHGAQPAHRPPPDLRPDDRARRRHPVPGRCRGRTTRLALGDC